MWLLKNNVYDTLFKINEIWKQRMKINNNYNECLTNLACSIRKYFELAYNHNTLSYIDEILEEKNLKMWSQFFSMEWVLIY